MVSGEAAGNIRIEYANAQGSIPTLTQIVDRFVSHKVDLLATCTHAVIHHRRAKNQNHPHFYDGIAYG